MLAYELFILSHFTVIKCELLFWNWHTNLWHGPNIEGLNRIYHGRHVLPTRQEIQIWVLHIDNLIQLMQNDISFLTIFSQKNIVSKSGEHRKW